METTAISTLVHSVAEEFEIKIDSVQFREKNSLLSIRRKNQITKLILASRIGDFPSDILEALFYVGFARFSKNTHRPKYQQQLRILHTYKSPNQPKKKEYLHQPEGQIYNLTQIMQNIAEQYSYVFGDYFTNNSPILRWSPRTSFRRFGYYRKQDHSITISKSLDQVNVPEYVIDYVVFHELLHAFLGIPIRNGKQCGHDSKFHQYEKLHPFLEKANIFLMQYARALRKIK